MHAVNHGYNSAAHEQHEQVSTKQALIVDDELSNRIILKSFLKKIGYSVIQAENGAQALELFCSEQPDMIFMDVMMPVMDGHEAVRRIRGIETTKFVPIIFLTARTDESVLSHCIEVGGDDFLTKPFSHTVLKAKVLSMERISRLHEKLGSLYAQMKKDEEMAEGVFSGAVIAGNVAMEHVRTLLQPAALFSGDVLLSAYGPSGDLNIMLGDFTGHGLAAAIGALPVSEAFRAMTHKGFSPQQILSGINRKLHGLLPTGMFFAVQFVSLSHTLDHVTVCNCGMPDVLLIDGENGEIKHRFVSNNLPLSIVSDTSYEETIQPYPVKQGDRVLLVSDGVLEARNPAKEYFGQARLDATIQNSTSPFRLIEEITDSLRNFCGDAPQDDDISLAEMPCEQIVLADWACLPPTQSKHTRHHFEEQNRPDQAIEFSIRLAGAHLRKSDPIPPIINQLQEMLGLQNQRRLLYTILTELYVNALDHGVLGLSSSLKQSPEGFTRYFSEREARLGNLDGGAIKIIINAQPTASGGSMIIEMEDSGPGFDYNSRLPGELPPDTQFSGRGIKLVSELCDSIEYEATGNRVKAAFSWTND